MLTRRSTAGVELKAGESNSNFASFKSRRTGLNGKPQPRPRPRRPPWAGNALRARLGGPARVSAQRGSQTERERVKPASEST